VTVCKEANMLEEQQHQQMACICGSKQRHHNANICNKSGKSAKYQYIYQYQSCLA